jgi:hypothetical protein
LAKATFAFPEFPLIPTKKDTFLLIIFPTTESTEEKRDPNKKYKF